MSLRISAGTTLLLGSLLSSGALASTARVLAYSGASPPGSADAGGLETPCANWAALPARIVRSGPEWRNLGKFVGLGRELGREGETLNILKALAQKVPSTALTIAMSEMSGVPSRVVSMPVKVSSSEPRLRAHLALRRAVDGLLDGRSLDAISSLGSATSIIDESLSHLPEYQLQLAKTLALLEPTEARWRAWWSWREFKRRGDAGGKEEASSVLAVISRAVAPEAEQPWLRVAVRESQARSTTEQTYRSLAQLASTRTGGSTGPRISAAGCGALRAWRLRVDCGTEVLSAAWSAGEIAAAMEAYARLPSVADLSAHPVLLVRSTTATLPLLRTAGRWASFEKWKRAGLRASERLGMPRVSNWIVLESSRVSRMLERRAAMVSDDQVEEMTAEERATALADRARWHQAEGAPRLMVGALEEALALLKGASVRTRREVLMAVYDLEPELLRGHSERHRFSADESRDPSSQVIWKVLVEARRRESDRRLDEAQGLYERAVGMLVEGAPGDFGDDFTRRELIRRVNERLAAVALGVDDPLEALEILEATRHEPGQRRDHRWSHLRSHLRPSDLIVFLGRVDGRVQAWGIDHGATRSVSITTQAGGWERRLSAWADLLRQPTLSADVWTEMGESLARTLVRPMLREGWFQGKRRVTIIPPSALREVPFDVLLQMTPETEVATRDGVQFASSLTELERAWHEPGATGRPVVFVPGAGQLAFTEGRSIADSLDASLYVGPSATKQAFLGQPAGPRILHFGGHSEPPDLLIGRGGLSLRPFSGGRGVLRFAEVAEMSLAGSVVVLMGCDTVGRKADAGMLTALVTTLGDAFLTAGSRSVVGSLWSIDDTIAREVSLLFYELGGPERGAAALVAAKALLRARYADEPSRWAGFVWHGAPPSA